MRLSGHPRRVCLLLAVGIAAVAPATAHAATVGESAGSLSFAAGAGEANDVTIAPFGLALKVTDTSAKGGKSALGVGTGCWKLSNNSAACAVPPNGIQFEGGDGDDRLDASALTVTKVNANGGSGNDVLLTGGGADTVNGGDGVDTLSGGAGDDSLQARDGEADRIVCGGGSDSGIADAEDTIAADCESVLPPAPVSNPDPDPGVDPDPVDPGTDPGTDPGDPGTDPGDSSDPDQGDDSNGNGNGNGNGGDSGTKHNGTQAANAVPPSIPPQTVGVSASGVATVKIVCPADSGGCSGTVVIELPAGAGAKRYGKHTLTAAAAPKRAALKLGKAKFRAKAGTTPVVAVRLSKRGRQRIIRGRRSRARITVTTRSATGGTVVTSQDVTIRARRSAARRSGRKARP